jgi:hypothetical protein
MLPPVETFGTPSFWNPTATRFVQLESKLNVSKAALSSTTKLVLIVPPPETAPVTTIS